ncbi:hypothetical protein [Variovorax sp. ZT4R33]|uniref:hypothetical protein n=1 Tax=Variovorax sp. ZT4R33 TaxID=3443743 RepID=UPI003F45930F
MAAWQAQQEDIDAKLVLKKCRYGEHQEYTWRLWFDRGSMQYRSQPKRYPFHYVDFTTQEAPHADRSQG